MADTSTLDGQGGSYSMIDNSRECRCQEWEASVNSTESCPCLDDPDADGQVR